MAPLAEPIIEVEDLVSRYGNRTILDGVELTVNRGEIRVIMGGSGSGKTTLLRSLLGLKEPASGTIRVLGKAFDRKHSKNMYEVRKQTGVAFQGGALFGSMTVRENCQVPLRQHARLDQKTMDIMTRIKLELVNLAGFEDLMPSELSGGMIKRAALARALMMDPKLLFFDEPSAGLDPVTSAELDELILKIRDGTNTTIVIVTHELESALKIADRMTVLGNGKVVMTGTVDEVRASADNRIQEMLNRRPREVKVDPEEYLQRLTEQRKYH
jgi:phospholipid/cholesterol/gamma-HCH transport system ATP-binding protein